MKVTYEYCDVCKEPLEGRNKMGLVVTIGYSQGGWGHRRNIVNFSGEVCRPCHLALGENFAKSWEERRAQIRSPEPPPRAHVIPEEPITHWQRIWKCLFG